MSDLTVYDWNREGADRAFTSCGGMRENKDKRHHSYWMVAPLLVLDCLPYHFTSIVNGYRRNSLKRICILLCIK